MEIGKAFGFVTEDEQWITKVLLGGLISLIPFVGALAIYGYSYRVAQNVARGNLRPMPAWGEFGDLLARGFFAWVIQIVYLLPVMVLYFLFAILTAGAAALTTDSDGGGGAGALIGLCLLPLVIIAAIVCGLAALAAIMRFLATDSFGEAFKFGEVFASIRNNIGTLIMLLVVAILAGLAASLGLIACGVGVLFTTFYAQCVIGHAIGQVMPRFYPMRGVPVAPGYGPPPGY
ncbi:MAG: DUF4013 domain-containing protein [Chloroflexi bacterium]|nr:DUF4013 domain-containing protein [Chloroflexota bacterium]